MKAAGNKCALISKWLVKAIVKENDVRCRWNPKELVTPLRKFTFKVTSLTYGGLYVQRTKGLLDCQMDIDTPPYGVVTSLLVLAWTCLA